MAPQRDPVNDSSAGGEHLPIQWDHGGSTTIPSGALVRGRKFEECIVCEGICEPENMRGMVCAACRIRPVPGEPEDDVIELVVGGESR